MLYHLILLFLLWASSIAGLGCFLLIQRKSALRWRGDYKRTAERLYGAEVYIGKLVMKHRAEIGNLVQTQHTENRVYWRDVKEGDVLGNKAVPMKFHVIRVIQEPAKGLLLSFHPGGRGSFVVTADRVDTAMFYFVERANEGGG